MEFKTVHTTTIDTSQVKLVADQTRSISPEPPLSEETNQRSQSAKHAPKKSRVLPRKCSNTVSEMPISDPRSYGKINGKMEIPEEGPDDLIAGNRAALGKKERSNLGL